VPTITVVGSAWLPAIAGDLHHSIDDRSREMKAGKMPIRLESTIITALVALTIMAFSALASAVLHATAVV
jgi:heme/copper-type cytochrome/quinol oxidase subunit 1